MAAPNLAQLKQAVTIAEQIEKLQAELARLLGGGASAASARTASPASPNKKRGKRTMSPAARAKIAAAVRAHWAKVKGTAVASVKAPAAVAKKKRKLSPEGRARIVAAMKARWAAKKGAAASSAKK
ncbi:MAG: hypothetical protein Q7S40_18710 [Opitutaceae bacterium]|nr:hypothetical protein [Opitutaceae bacterium]